MHDIVSMYLMYHVSSSNLVRKVFPMHDIVSMYLMYHVSSIIIVMYPIVVCCCFTLHGLLVNHTCVLHLLICAATKWKKVPAKKSVRKNKKNIVLAATSAFLLGKNREAEFCRLCRYISDLVACFQCRLC
jgi:hypothetical protein